MKFEICDPDRDETAWHPADDTDAASAAEAYARDRCSRDPECYSGFEGDGAVLLVRGAGRTVPVRVSVELVPTFHARRVS
jgi:hypothetical protein